MAKFYGINPQPATRQAVERTGNVTMIKNDNHSPVTTVYFNMDETGAGAA